MDAVLIVGIPAVLAAGVLVRARWWPYGPCPACSGRRGRGRGSSSKAYNRCRRCGGQGERIRPLAQIYPKWREEARRREEARK